jgi:putative ABC transport system permease protein
MSYVALDLEDLVAAALLMILDGLLVWGFRLGLERTLAIAVVRMVVQLGAIGFVLKIVFALTSPLLTGAMAIAMVLIAGHEVLARQETRLKGWAAYGLGTATLFSVGLLATLYAMLVVIAPEPWYAPRYVLPILGMVLGNTLTGVGLVLNTLSASVVRDCAAIEARLALGATRLEAMADVLSHAIRTGLMPILNAMAASGVVSLPGMMTGQILAGLDPVEAAKYQIMIMFLLAGATGFAVVLAGLGGALRLTDSRHRLRLDRLAGRR